MHEEAQFSSAEEQLVYLQALIEAEDHSGLYRALADKESADLARWLESFPANQRHQIWLAVPDSQLGEVLAEVAEDIRTEYMTDMSVADVTEIVKGLDAQEVAEVLDVVEDHLKTEVYESLDEIIRSQVEVLQAYDEATVGRYMDPETVNVKQGVTLEAVQRFVRIHKLLDEESQEIMVTDKDKRLLGTITLIDLVKQNQDSLVDEFMYKAFTLNDNMKVNDAASVLRARELYFAPVTNAEGVLVGQLNIADILEITQDDSDMTLKHMSGVSDEEELFSPILQSAKSRGIWLGINLATAFLAAAVIGQFEAVLEQVVALAVLMPVVASMGGIAGSQTLTVVIRGMALGQIAGNNKVWLFNKELWVGLTNGFIWALVVGLVAHLWFGDPKISLVISIAILVNMTLANLAGIAIPLVLKKLKIDPALSGAVILTTVTDVAGFLSFLGLATLIILH